MCPAGRIEITHKKCYNNRRLPGVQERVHPGDRRERAARKRRARLGGRSFPRNQGLFEKDKSGTDTASNKPLQ